MEEIEPPEVRKQFVGGASRTRPDNSSTREGPKARTTGLEARPGTKKRPRCTSTSAYKTYEGVWSW